MSKEIERKFLLSNLPKFLVLMDVRRIEQNYLSNGDEELRIRKEEKVLKFTNDKETKYTLTIKKGTGLVREENEVEITESTYLQLVSVSKTKPIIKQRGVTRLKDLKIEVDTYENDELGTLVVAEIEFDTAQEAVDAVLPDWLGADITDDASYKNQNLWQKVQPQPEPETEPEVSESEGNESLEGVRFITHDEDEECDSFSDSEAESYTIEDSDMYENLTLKETHKDKNKAILRAHSMLSYSHEIVIRGWVDGEEVSRYTIKRE